MATGQLAWQQAGQCADLKSLLAGRQWLHTFMISDRQAHTKKGVHTRAKNTAGKDKEQAPHLEERDQTDHAL